MIDLTWLGSFHIITHPELDSVICHLTYLTFQINISNQPFESTYAINFFIKLAAPLACGTLPPQTYIHKRVYSYLLSYMWFKWLTFLQIAYLSSCGVYCAWAPLDGGVNENPAGRSEDFSLMQTSVLSTMNVRVLTRWQRPLMGRPVEPRPDNEYVDLDLTLI